MINVSFFSMHTKAVLSPSTDHLADDSEETVYKSIDFSFLAKWFRHSSGQSFITKSCKLACAE